MSNVSIVRIAMKDLLDFLMVFFVAIGLIFFINKIDPKSFTAGSIKFGMANLAKPRPNIIEFFNRL